MGYAVVPMLLEEISTSPDHWDIALTEITGADPVPQESYGKLRDMSAAWVNWGRMRHLI